MKEKTKLTRLKQNNTYTLRVWMSSGRDQTNFKKAIVSISFSASWQSALIPLVIMSILSIFNLFLFLQ